MRCLATFENLGLIVPNTIQIMKGTNRKAWRRVIGDRLIKKIRRYAQFLNNEK